MKRSSLITLQSSAELKEVLRHLAVRSVVADVEPLACVWGSDDRALREGIDAVLQVAADSSVVTDVAFVTNSRRVPSRTPARDGIHVSYHPKARKPWLALEQLKALPRPAVVVGDQLLTDGLLAWRLSVPFVRIPLPPGSPLSVKAQRLCDRPLARLLFRSM
jgi:predicted HAD superfamily phosphohydrolase YqeG